MPNPFGLISIDPKKLDYIRFRALYKSEDRGAKRLYNTRL